MSTYRSIKTKKRSKSLSLKVFAAAYGNVCLHQCKNTDFSCELNEVSNKAAVSGTVCLRVSVKRASTVQA